MAWYEINTPEESFNKELATPPRIEEELWLVHNDHSVAFIVKRVVHAERSERGERPTTILFVEPV
jgi:hypothetical protein